MHLLSGEHMEILAREVGWEKVVCWSTKAAICLKRVQIEEKLLWGSYRNSPTLFPTAPSPTPNGLPDALYCKAWSCDCMSSVCASVHPSDVGGSGPHRLEILEINFMDKPVGDWFAR